VEGLREEVHSIGSRRKVLQFAAFWLQSLYGMEY